jgi:dTMP kinase
MTGKLITFEGIDGAGKTTVIKLVYDYLKNERKEDVITTFTPGGTPFGEEIKKILLKEESNKTPDSFSFLFFCDHTYHAQRIIIPALNQGKTILCDRYIDSFIAYQEFGYQLNIDLFADFLLSPEIPVPWRTFLLDVSIENAKERISKRKDKDSMDDMDVNFYNRVKQGYNSLLEKHPNRIKKVNANLDPRDMFLQIKELV